MKRDWSWVSSIFDVGRQGGGDLRQPFLDGIGYGHSVGSRLLLHEQADAVLAIEAGEAAGLLDGVLHTGHIPHA